jgi:hypothetical protein
MEQPRPSPFPLGTASSGRNSGTIEIFYGNNDETKGYLSRGFFISDEDYPQDR